MTPYEAKAVNLISWHRKHVFAEDTHVADCHSRAIRRLKALSGLAKVPAYATIRKYRGEVRVDDTGAFGYFNARYVTRTLYSTAMGTFRTKREATASLRHPDAH